MQFSSEWQIGKFLLSLSNQLSTNQSLFTSFPLTLPTAKNLIIQLFFVSTYYLVTFLHPICIYHQCFVYQSQLRIMTNGIFRSHGSQCGFCTPGIVMSMYTLLRNNPLPSMEDVETYFQVPIFIIFLDYMDLGLCNKR